MSAPNAGQKIAPGPTLLALERFIASPSSIVRHCLLPKWRATVAWMVKVRPYAWHWLEEHAKIQCAEGGAGRKRDLEAPRMLPPNRAPNPIDAGLLKASTQDGRVRVPEQEAPQLCACRPRVIRALLAGRLLPNR